MEAVRQVIDSTLLDGIVYLPKRFENKRVEIVISLDEDSKALPSLKMGDIDAMLKGSITETLTGIIPKTEKTLDDYRAERLAKYECAN